MQYISVVIGGAFGAISRYQLGKMIAERSRSSIPLGTMGVNILGALCLGYFSNIGLSHQAYALIGDGFFGAFTTFSSFMYEGFKLFEEDDKRNAITYILITLVIGLVGYHIGSIIARG
jgi:CrcB protein